MTHHDGTETEHADNSDPVAATAVGRDGANESSHVHTTDDAVDPLNADRTVDEAADYVHPVDHGSGTDTEPLESEEGGDYVSGADADDASGDPAGSEEKGDYVNPVDHGPGAGDEPVEDAGDYVSPTNQPPGR